MKNLNQLLNQYNLRPRKGLGQNFLTDPFHLNKIVSTADVEQTDTILEVGPGPGALTELLAERAQHVVAVEVDRGMVNLLRHEYTDLDNLTIIEADILKTSIDELFQKCQLPIANHQYSVVANLPYYITSAVIRHLLEADPAPKRIVVTIQKEVAQRIVAKAGKMSLLAVSVQFYGQPSLIHHIPAGAFYPSPKVDSAVLRIDTFTERPVIVSDENLFFRVVKAGFSQKRKQLKNSLAGGLQRPIKEITPLIEQANIDPKRRAETLTLTEWGRLTEIVH
ncbi:16S rRNA (adenine(1518)-N(6)/adenine(1519)-N(6))-dimethyltransferase RsmA [Anaerolineales bacterium HSG6]|nr:16S rRNA (adenine(1518)-N(6)/adenine(1519)-N(6))-dimethyltransferase RsmA [Anaerolineales bacterium HSG6]